MAIRLTKRNPNFDPTVYESFLADIYDLQKFKENFIKVSRPLKGGGYEVVPFIPYTYQNAWSADENPQKAANKSRQVGFTFNEMADALQKALIIPNYRKLVTSVTQPQANEVLRVGIDIVNLMEPEYQPTLRAKARNILEFEHNGSRIMALPNSASAVRTYNGDVFLDELAHVANDASLLDAILSLTVREGRQVHIGSTPYGQRGRFHGIFKDAGWDTTSEWHDKALVKEFFRKYMKFQLNNSTKWSCHLMTWWMCPDLHWERIIEVAKTKDARRQEYGLAFLDESTAVLSYQLLLDHVNPKLEQFKSISIEKKPKGVRRIGGLDPAERGNETAFIVFDLINNVYYKKYVETWQNTPHTEYCPTIAEYIKMWQLDKLYVDETGMGIPIMSTLKTMVNSVVLHPISFTNPLKAALVYNMLAIYEAGGDNKAEHLIQTDHDSVYMDQLHQLRKEKNKQGRDVYTGKIEGLNDDIIWATALALIENIDPQFREVQFEVVRRTNIGGNPYGK